jgi:hypothetical protein
MTGTDLFVNKSQFVPVIFEPLCTSNCGTQKLLLLSLLSKCHMDSSYTLNAFLFTPSARNINVFAFFNVRIMRDLSLSLYVMSFLPNCSAITCTFKMYHS